MSNSYTSLFYHIVWSTKEKAPFFSKKGKDRLYNYINNIISKKRIELLAIGGTSNHVHVLVRMNSIDTVAGFVRHTKASSSGFVNKMVGDKYKFEWQKSYGVFTVSASAANRVRDYIINQEEHHKTCGLEKELELFLRF